MDLRERTSTLLRARGGWVPQAIRYTALSTVAFIIDLLLLAALIEWGGLGPVLASVIGYSLVMIIEYGGSIAWVFSQRRFEARRMTEFSAFVGIGVLGLAVNTLVMYLATMGGLHYIIAKFAAGFGVLVFTFAVRRWALFSVRPGRSARRAAKLELDQRISVGAEDRDVPHAS